MVVVVAAVRRVTVVLVMMVVAGRLAVPRRLDSCGRRLRRRAAGLLQLVVHSDAVQQRQQRSVYIHTHTHTHSRLTALRPGLLR